ncbi:ABC transporter permease [Domibacillus indicus]|uniref:ABC transporter permease n=1 Tax=Domibacillus indicus TaxID=1437523 RepID=UPI000618056A|nr:ABC transporter permease [Domibacillus indicus]
MKFSVNELFKERSSAYYAEIRKYTRYMLNDHLLFVLVFALGALLFYYSGWVETIEEGFPAVLIMAAVMGIVLAWSPVYTYIKRPDTVYLLPLESEMKPYFRKAAWTSFAAQSYLLIALLAFAMPMYAKAEGTGFGNFFVFLGAVLAAKLWNLFCRLEALNVPSNDVRMGDMAIRLLLNAAFLFAVFSAEYGLAGIALLFMVFWIFYMGRIGNRPLKWELLADLEEKRMAAFYRLANMFTDVPHLRGTVKRRAWLDGLLPGSEKGTYTYLLARTFVRMSEYSGLFVRLTAISAFIIALSGLLPVQLIAALLFLYLTGFQLLPISARHGYIIWPRLYPEGEEGKSRAVQNLLMRILLIQSIVFGVSALSAGLMEGAIVLAASVTFTLFFVWIYAPARLKKINRL